MSKVAIYRVAVLACAMMSLSARNHEQIALSIMCWVVLAVVHDKVVDTALQTHTRRWRKIMWMVVAAQSAQAESKKLAAWLCSDLSPRKRADDQSK